MRLRSLAVALAVMSAGFAAHADSFTFSFGTPSSMFSGSGVLTTGVLLAPGEYTIANVTGTAATKPMGPSISISSILAPGIFPTPANGGSFPANDNTLFAFNSVGTLSQNGVSFILSDGSQINLFNGGSGANAFLKPVGGSGIYEIAATTIKPSTAVAVTPEPSTVALLGTGLLSLVGVARRRFR